MEIINPNTLPGDNSRVCSTDALLLPNPCYDDECRANCDAHNPNNPCYTCKLAD